jgi:hypothetical protein
MSNHEIAHQIKAMNLDGWGGKCFEAAVKINQAVFNGKGTYLAACNRFMHEIEDQFIGHVVVKFGDDLWDTDGLTEMDRLESWGMLDPHDSEYSGILGWTEESAYEVKIMELTENEMRRYLDVC